MPYRTTREKERRAVSDAHRATLFSAESPHRPWRRQLELRHITSRMKGILLESDRSLRERHRGDQPRDKEARRFAHHLAQRLDQGFAQGSYRQLILVAPPRFSR